MVLKYDHVRPQDLQRWLTYVGMNEEEFDSIADSFRDEKSLADKRWAVAKI